MPLAIELRHPAFFRDGALLDEVVDLLWRHRAHVVITDTPGRQDVRHTSLTSGKVFLRFQGQDYEEADRARVAAWAERLAAWAESGVEEIYVACHQPGEERIPETVSLFAEELRKRGRGEQQDWEDMRRRVEDGARLLF